jgi:hypothetical protein
MIVLLFLSSCRKPEPVNSVPVAYSDVSPLSGVTPLSSHVKAWGSDADGLDDIKLYDLNVNGRDSTSSSPFDFVRTFSVPGSYRIYSVVTDSHGATSKSNVVTVDVSGPGIVPSSCSIDFLSSTSGDSPLSVPLKTSGVSGSDPIVGYRLHVDGKVSSLKKSSIDTVLVLYAGSHTVFADALTASGKSVSSSSYNIDVNWVSGPDLEWARLSSIPLPKSPLNLFAPRDNTAGALEYDAAPDRIHKDALIASRVDANYLSHFPSSDTPPVFNCNNYMIGAVIGSIKSLGTNLYFEEWSNKDFKLFDWYTGTDPLYIRAHGGTFDGAGDGGLPVLELTTESSIGNHGLIGIISGNDLSVSSMNNLDFQFNITNIVFGQYDLFKNCKATYSYPYSYTTVENGVTKTHLTEINVMIVDYVDGAATNVRYNPNIELVKTRNGK